MLLLVSFVLFSQFNLVLGESSPAEVLEGKRPCQIDTVLETCQALQDAAQLIRLEGYSAIDKAELIRDQAYRVKDEAYDIKDEAYEIKESVLEARTQHETTLIEVLGLIHKQVLTTNSYVDEIRKTLEAVSGRMATLEQRVQSTQDEVGDVKQRFEGMDSEIKERLDEVNSEISEIKQGIDGLENEISHVITQGLDRLDGEISDVKQGLEELGQSVDDRISGFTETVSGDLVKLEKLQTIKFIPAARVAQSTTYADYTGPENAVDGKYNTQSHTTCDQPLQWFRYYFPEERSVGLIKVVNGKYNFNRVRLNGARVSVMVDEEGRRSCRDDTITVREGETIRSQTYYLDCSGNTGIGVEFVLDTGTCLEFIQIEVYAF